MLSTRYQYFKSRNTINYGSRYSKIWKWLSIPRLNEIKRLFSLRNIKHIHTYALTDKYIHANIKMRT